MPKMGYIKRGLVTNVYFLSNILSKKTLGKAQESWEDESSAYFAATETTMMQWESDKMWYPQRTEWNVVGEVTVGKPRSRVRKPQACLRPGISKKWRRR